MPDKTCELCSGTGKIDHAISGETQGPDIDAERAAWAHRHQITCPMCGGSGEHSEAADFIEGANRDR